MDKNHSLRMSAGDLRIYVCQSCLSTILGLLEEQIGILLEILVYFQYSFASDLKYNKLKGKIYICLKNIWF